MWKKILIISAAAAAAVLAAAGVAHAADANVHIDPGNGEFYGTANISEI